MEAKRAQAKEYLFLLGLGGGPKSGIDDSALVRALLSCCSAMTNRGQKQEEEEKGEREKIDVESDSCV